MLFIWFLWRKQNFLTSPDMGNCTILSDFKVNVFWNLKFKKTLIFSFWGKVYVVNLGFQRPKSMYSERNIWWKDAKIWTKIWKPAPIYICPICQNSVLDSDIQYICKYEGKKQICWSFFNQNESWTVYLYFLFMLIENENILNSKSGKFILTTNIKMHSKRTVFDAYVLYLGHYIDSRIKDRKVNNGEGICILTTINHI